MNRICSSVLICLYVYFEMFAGFAQTLCDPLFLNSSFSETTDPFLSSSSTVDGRLYGEPVRQSKDRGYDDDLVDPDDDDPDDQGDGGDSDDDSDPASFVFDF